MDTPAEAEWCQDVLAVGVQSEVELCVVAYRLEFVDDTPRLRLITTELAFEGVAAGTGGGPTKS